MADQPIPEFPSDEYFAGSAFGAVEYLKDWFGIPGWVAARNRVHDELCTICFTSQCREWGVTSGFAIQAWFEHFHGGGSWAKTHDECLEKHKESAYANVFTLIEAGMPVELVEASFSGIWHPEVEAKAREALADLQAREGQPIH